MSEPSIRYLHNHAGRSPSEVLEHLDVLLDAFDDDSADQLLAGTAIQRLCENEPDTMGDYIEELNSTIKDNLGENLPIELVRGIAGISRHDPQTVADNFDGICEILKSDNIPPEHTKVALLVSLELLDAGCELPPEVARSALDGVLSGDPSLEQVSLDTLGYCAKHVTSDTDTAVVGLSIGMHANHHGLKEDATEFLADAVTAHPDILDDIEWTPNDELVGVNRIPDGVSKPAVIKQKLQQNTGRFQDLFSSSNPRFK